MDPERQWLEHTRRGPGVPQLTVRAMALGSLLGAVTGLSNLWIGLKIGWGLGVVLTASVLGWGLSEALRRLRLTRGPMSVLELAMMASTASAAGYSTGVNLVSAVAAWAMIEGAHLPLATGLAWTASVAGLGLAFAILVKRRLVNVEALPFPTGRAAAETLRTITAGDGEAGRTVRVLVLGMTAGAALVLFGDGLRALAAALDLPWLAAIAVPKAWPGPGLQAAFAPLAAIATYGFSIELSGLLVAAGAIAGVRTACSVFSGALLGWGVLAPFLVHDGIVASPSYRDVVGFSVWVGVPLMVAASLVHLPRLGEPLLRAVASSLRRSPREGESPIEAVEVPRRWFLPALVVAGVPCVLLQVLAFSIPWPLALLAIALAGVLTIVAARVTGETDVTPTGPLAKITQLGYGALAPGATIGNLMATGVTAGAATSAADLLTDLKSGWLLGAEPRQQFWAQAIGVLVGTAIVVPLFLFVVVPDPTALGSAQWPAPAAQAWRAVAELVSGTALLPPGAPLAIAISAAIGLTLGVLERRPRWRRLLPSPTALGLGVVMPATSGLSFLLGGIVAWRVARRGGTATSTALAAAAGVIAGESISGLLVAVAAT
jgi:uncharacterized oligopeptide transporter (OPT) family protein